MIHLDATGGWLEDRLHLRTVAARILSGSVDPRWAWLRTTGMVCLMLVLIECITGPILGLYYTPSPTAAYKDILAIEQNPFGRFLRGMHHWSSAALILLTVFTVARMFFGAEYKGRRDVVWIVSVIFLQVVLFFQISGHAMPWDTNAVSTVTVEAGITNNVWVAGPEIKRLILGGSTTGAVTLARWYGVHALLLPLSLVGAIGLPLLLHRLRGDLRDSWDSRESSASGPHHTTEHYYPFHMAREMLAAIGVFAIMAGLALFAKTPLEKEATAANLSGYVARSEWYVLPMHAATLLPPFNNPAFEPLATVVGPGALFTVLLLLPFLDRNPERRLSKRRFAAACGVFTLASVFGLYGFALVKERRQAVHETSSAGSSGLVAAAVDAILVEQGKSVYSMQGCGNCHTIGGAGGKVGPDLTKAGSLHPDRQWQIDHLIKPGSKVAGSTMPAYGQLKKEELQALAEYMISLK